MAFDHDLEFKLGLKACKYKARNAFTACFLRQIPQRLRISCVHGCSMRLDYPVTFRSGPMATSATSAWWLPKVRKASATMQTFSCNASTIRWGSVLALNQLFSAFWEKLQAVYEGEDLQKGGRKGFISEKLEWYDAIYQDIKRNGYRRSYSIKNNV